MTTQTALPKIEVPLDSTYPGGLSYFLIARKSQLANYQRERSAIQSEQFKFDPAKIANPQQPLRSHITREIQERAARAEWEQDRNVLLEQMDRVIAGLEEEIESLETQLAEKQKLIDPAKAEINEAIAAYEEQVQALFASHEKLNSAIVSHQGLFKDCGHKLPDYKDHYVKAILSLPRPSWHPIGGLQLTNFLTYKKS